MRWPGWSRRRVSRRLPRVAGTEAVRGNPRSLTTMPSFPLTRSQRCADKVRIVTGTDRPMQVGMLWDWMGRIFGVAFILFMLYVLFFPGSAEQEDETEARPAGSFERARIDGGTEPSTVRPDRRLDDDFGNVLAFPEHRKAHH